MDHSIGCSLFTAAVNGVSSVYEHEDSTGNRPAADLVLRRSRGEPSVDGDQADSTRAQASSKPPDEPVNGSERGMGTLAMEASMSDCSSRFP